MEDGLLVAGPGVDVAARRLDLVGDRAHAALLGALEEHVLEHVRGADLAFALVGGAGVDPRLHGGGGRTRSGPEEYRETAIESSSQWAFFLLARQGSFEVWGVPHGTGPSAARDEH